MHRPVRIRHLIYQRILYIHVTCAYIIRLCAKNELLLIGSQKAGARIFHHLSVHIIT